tara:strand:- start:1636 stop:2190 length:555 start_codon:yes stop_codon:yes gene_type:complete
MRNLLIARFVLLNIFGGAFLFLAFKLGFVEEAYNADPTWISESIYLLFVAGLVTCGYRIWQCARMLDGKHSRVTDFLLTKDREVLRVKLDSREVPIAYIGYILVTLGFFGTVWGFKVALSGVDAGGVISAETIAPMISVLIEGMSLALFTTISGIIGYIWLGFNIRLLESGHKRLYTKLIEQVR